MFDFSDYINKQKEQKRQRKGGFDFGKLKSKKTKSQQIVSHIQHLSKKDVNDTIMEILNMGKIDNKEFTETCRFEELKNKLLDVLKDGLQFYADNSNIHEVVRKAVYILGKCADLNWINTSNVTNMSGLFKGHQNEVRNVSYSNWGFAGDISKWDVSNVTDMSHMFENSTFGHYYHRKDKSIPVGIGDWDVSNVKDMSYMFYNASMHMLSKNNTKKPELIKIATDLSKWDVSKVTDMSYMFAQDSKWPEYDLPDIGTWNTQSLKYANAMCKCTIIHNSFKLWNTSSLEEAPEMFAYCDFDEFDENNIYKDFGIDKWDLSKIKDMTLMFYHFCNYSPSDIIDNGERINKICFIPFDKLKINTRTTKVNDIFNATALSQKLGELAKTQNVNTTDKTTKLIFSILSNWKLPVDLRHPQISMIFI